VDVAVTRATKIYRAVDLMPVEGLLVLFVLVARAGNEMVARQPLRRTPTKLARAALRPASSRVFFHQVILPILPEKSRESMHRDTRGTGGRIPREARVEQG
jgi:hypothetical protein